MSSRFDVLIVGAGHGGTQAAIALRQRKYAGSIGMVWREQGLPYERPPLSKDYLSGQKPLDRMLLRPASFWETQGITLLPGRAVSALDSLDQELLTSNRERLGYGALVWAAGGAARQLTCAGNDLAGVHTMRSRDDVDRMRLELPNASHVVIIGAGYIGLEVAATLVKLGKVVTVVEALDRVLSRVAGVPVSRYIEAQHRAKGVALLLDTPVDCIEGVNGRVVGVRVRGGRLLSADMVVVGIGISPSVDPLLQAGAVGANGVDVDAQCRTTLPNVFAIGDCAAHVSAFAGHTRVRVESVQNATDQATTVAKVLTGEAATYDAVPWFWSDQFDIRLRSVGLSAGHDDVVVRGNPDSGVFSVVYLRQGRVVAIDTINSMREFTQGKSLVQRQVRPDREQLSDADIALNTLTI